MHPFSVMQSFPTGRFVTLCFYCFFLAEIVFSGYKKTALRLFLGARYWIRTNPAFAQTYWLNQTTTANTTTQYNFPSRVDFIA